MTRHAAPDSDSAKEARQWKDGNEVKWYMEAKVKMYLSWKKLQAFSTVFSIEDNVPRTHRVFYLPSTWISLPPPHPFLARLDAVGVRD